MSQQTLLNIAKTFENLTSKGNHPFQQISDIKDSAHMLKLVAPLFETAALGHYDPDDIYEEDTEAPARAAQAKNAINQINDIAAYIKHKAYKEGLSTTDCLFYKNKILGLLRKLESVPKNAGDAHDMVASSLSKFEEALKNWNPAGFKAIQPASEPKEQVYNEQLSGKRQYHEPMSHMEHEPGGNLLEELYQ